MYTIVKHKFYSWQEIWTISCRKITITASLSAVLTLGFISTGKADGIVANGSFETWGDVAGTPPTGNPMSWKSNGVYQVAGLATGSTYAAAVSPKGVLFQVLNEPQSSFELNFEFAATDPGSSSARSLHLILMGGTGPKPTALITLRTVQGLTAGTLDLQAWDGTMWQTLGSGLIASAYDSTNNTFPSLKTYNVTLTANLNSGTYTISYGLAGADRTTATVSYFANPPTGLKMSEVYFDGNSSASLYAVDDVSLKANAVAASASGAPTTSLDRPELKLRLASANDFRNF